MDPVIIWTRPADEKASDKTLFFGDENHVVWLPCIRTQAVAMASMHTFQGLNLLFTSPNAIRHLPEHKKKELKKAAKIYTFSQKSAQILQENDCRNLEFFADCQNAKRFADALQRRVKDPASHFLWLRGKDFAFDLKFALSELGFKVSDQIVYETIALRPLLPAGPYHWIVAFASPSAVQAFQSLLEEKNRAGLRLEAVCLGQTTARALKEEIWNSVEIVPEASVLELAKTCLKKCWGRNY